MRSMKTSSLQATNISLQVSYEIQFFQDHLKEETILIATCHDILWLVETNIFFVVFCSLAMEEIANIGLPRMYRPPEAFQILKPFESLNGRAFDRWTVGVMAFELLTNFHMIGSIRCRHLGAELRYASMRGALQEQAFAEKMQGALPAVELTPDDVQMARDFIHSFLKVEPTARMTAEGGMSHKFLGCGDVVNDEVDALWQPSTPKRFCCLKCPVLWVEKVTRTEHILFNRNIESTDVLL